MVYIVGNGSTLLVGTWQCENMNKLVEWKTFLDSVEIDSVDLADEFLLSTFAAFPVTMMYAHDFKFTPD